MTLSVLLQWGANVDAVNLRSDTALLRVCQFNITQYASSVLMISIVLPSSSFCRVHSGCSSCLLLLIPAQSTHMLDREACLLTTRVFLYRPSAVVIWTVCSSYWRMEPTPCRLRCPDQHGLTCPFSWRATTASRRSKTPSLTPTASRLRSF